MLAMVLRSVRYAPPIEGSDTRLKKLPKAVKVSVDANDWTRLTTARAPKGPACSVSEVAPAGNAAVSTRSAAEMTIRRKYPTMKGAYGELRLAHLQGERSEEDQRSSEVVRAISQCWPKVTGSELQILMIPLRQHSRH